MNKGSRLDFKVTVENRDVVTYNLGAASSYHSFSYDLGKNKFPTIRFWIDFGAVHWQKRAAMGHGCSAWQAFWWILVGGEMT